MPRGWTSSRAGGRVSSGDLARRLIALKRDWNEISEQGLRGWKSLRALSIHDEMDALLGMLVDRGVELPPIPCEWHQAHRSCHACAGIACDL